MGEEGLFGWLRTWLLYAPYTHILRAAVIWLIPCSILLAATMGLIWVRATPQWRTQTNRQTGMRETGMRSYLIGWGIVWTSGPVLLVITGAGLRVVDWITAHPWLPPVTLAVIGVAVAAVLGIRHWLHNRPPKLPPIPQVQPQIQQPYDAPYGQWSGDEQVIR